ncbi:MAG: trypsin-like peptidase domain-containing protein [Firmicutes bacterium]|nr:trypsin-like peptidase domain-containing protein [Bacillota bacterium]
MNREKYYKLISRGKGEVQVNKEPEDWRDPLTPGEREDLDVDLISELNQDDTISEEVEDKSVDTRSPIILKVIGLLVIVAFMVTVWSNWLWILSVLPLDFLTKSGELTKNPNIQKHQQAVVMIKVSGRQGSGFNIDSNGLIITNEHVVEGARNVDVSFQDGSFYSGSVLAGYPDIDLAVIKIDGRNLPWLKLKLDANLTTGNEVIIIGNPLGFADVVMKGYVAGEIKLRGWNSPVVMVKGQIRPGSSGSPVLNNNGEVVAVVFGTIDSVAANEKTQAIGLAVPIKYLQNRQEVPFLFRWGMN